MTTDQQLKNETFGGKRYSNAMGGGVVPKKKAKNQWGVETSYLAEHLVKMNTPLINMLNV